MPKLSILIPTHNRADLLRRCLDSIVRQNSSAVEIIVSDNASDDGTPSVAATYKEIPNAHFYRHDTNIGAMANVHSLIGRATGKFLFFLTDDDYLEQGAVGRLCDLLTEQPNVGMFLSSVRLLDDRSGRFGAVLAFWPETTIFRPGEEALRAMFWACHILSRIMIQRDLFNVSALDDESLYGYLAAAGLVMKNSPVCYVHEALVVHTIHNKTFWEYSEDYMTGDVIEVIERLTRGEPYGPRLAKYLVRRSVPGIIRQLAICSMQLPSKARALASELMRHQGYRSQPLLMISVALLRVAPRRAVTLCWGVVQVLRHRAHQRAAHQRAVVYD